MAVRAAARVELVVRVAPRVARAMGAAAAALAVAVRAVEAAALAIWVTTVAEEEARGVTRAAREAEAHVVAAWAVPGAGVGAASVVVQVVELAAVVKAMPQASTWRSLSGAAAQDAI
jgi:urease alpha subunit